MKEKILAELKKKYAGQLTQSFMENLADRLAEKVTKEEEIQGVIDELDKLPIKIKDLQAEGDRRATELQKSSKQKVEELEAEIQKIKGLKKDEPLEKDYDKEIQALKQQIDDLSSTNKKERAVSKLREMAKSKKISSVLVDSVSIDDESKIDEVIKVLEEKQLKIKQEMIDSGEHIGTPRASNPTLLGDSSVKESIKANKIKKETKKE